MIRCRKPMAMNRLKPLLFLAVAALFPVLPAVHSAHAYPGNVVIMRGLDKVTARVSVFELAIGVPARFGALRLVAHKCDRTPPEEPPESAVLLSIEEIQPGQPPANIFSGWMFASSPALSALEHPVYDVWVLECRGTPPAPTSGN